MTDNIDYITDREYKISLLQSLSGQTSFITNDKELIISLSNLYNKYVCHQISDDDVDFKEIEAILKSENFDLQKISRLVFKLRG